MRRGKPLKPGKSHNSPQLLHAQVLRYLQFRTGFFLGSFTGTHTFFISGASKVRHPSSEPTEMRTSRGSWRAVTMCPSSLVTSQNLSRDGGQKRTGQG